MRNLLFKSILALSLCCSLLACSQHKKEEKVSGPLQVQIPFALDGNYSLKIIELVTLENLLTLKGSAAEFLIDPDTASGELHGRLPDLKYLKDDAGVIVPTDVLSLQLLTVYAHFEKMRDLDLKLGIAAQLVWPAKIAVNAKYKTADGTMVNNALYSSQYDALLMVPFVGNDMPIMINGGVLAHEHFHHIFQKLMTNRLDKSVHNKFGVHEHEEQKLAETFNLPKKIEAEAGEDGENSEEHDAIVRELYHQVLLRGLNEGLADVWGWVYSGDTSFVGRSLPQEKGVRDLSVMGREIATQQKIKEQIEAGNDDLLNYSYKLGTQFARVVKSFGQLSAQSQGLSPEESRNQIGALILKVLPVLAKTLNDLEKTQYLDPEQIIQMFMDESNKLASQECFYLAGLMKSQDRKNETHARCQGIENKENNNEKEFLQ